MKGDDKNYEKNLTELRKRIQWGKNLQNSFKRKKSLSRVYVCESKRTRAAVF